MRTIASSHYIPKSGFVNPEAIVFPEKPHSTKKSEKKKKCLLTK